MTKGYGTCYEFKHHRKLPSSNLNRDLASSQLQHPHVPILSTSPTLKTLAVLNADLPL